MSNIYYHELWKIIQEDLEKLIQSDVIIQDDKTPKSREIALKIILPIYMRYRRIVGQLISCYDQTIQSQRREIIKRLLDCSIGRMLEYKREIVKLNCTEYDWPNDFLIEMKWTPDDISLSPPSSYAADRHEQLERRRRQIQNLFDQANVNKDDISKLRVTQSGQSFATASVETKQELLQSTILKIQSHERARMGRVLAKKAEYNLNYTKKINIGEITVHRSSLQAEQRAAMTIQKYWRGYSARLSIKRRLEMTEDLLGMTIPSWKDRTMIQKDLQNFKRRQAAQPHSLKQIESIKIEQQAKIHIKKSESMKEDISDEIREWFNFYYEKLGHFGLFPAAKDGGSVLIVSGASPSPEEFADFIKKDKKHTKAKKSGKKKRKKKKTIFEGWIMPQSKTIGCLKQVANDFTTNWPLKTMFDDTTDKEHLGLIEEDIYHELQLKTRQVVDDFMRLELDRLNKALIKDHKKEKKKFKIPGLKKGRKKKRRRKKKKKTKEIPQEELNQMFEELIRAKIIRNYPETSLNQWLGDITRAQSSSKLMEHHLGDIKQAIIDYCILPMGSKNAHTVAPLTRSVCITGLPGQGKSFLADAVCYELGALLFDLSPDTLADKYEDKSEEKRLLKMIRSLAKEYAPAIVLVDGGDKPWWRKISPEDMASRPRRLAKLLPKISKSIKPGDQMLILGLSSEPWRAKKRFYRAYSKFIIIPPSDYTSLYQIYEKLLMNYHGIPRNFDISSLAKISIGYPIDRICQAIENVLNARRRVELKVKPLQVHEIQNELLKWAGPTSKTLNNYIKFKKKTPLDRKRRKLTKSII